MAISPPSAWRSCSASRCSASCAAAAFFEALATSPKILDLLDLVALGTVADVARLKSLNRAFVTQGLKIMAGRQNVGLAALAEAARLVKEPSCRDLGFALGPRINAGGRVGKSDLGVRLLTSTDPEEARAIAAELDRLNEERRAIEMLVCEQAEAQARDQADCPVIIVMSGGWHQGVIGIVAGRIKERFGRPAIVIAETEDGTGKGSGRSISGVDLGAAVLAAKDSGLLIAGGGHAMAAGLTLPPAGSSRSATSSTSGSPPMSRKSRGDQALLLDALLAPGGIAGALCDALDAAGPYGAGWPSPRVAAGPVRLLKTGIVGDGHVRGIGCRRRRQDLQVDRLPKRRDRARPGPARIRRRHALVARRDDQARRMERRQRGRDAPRGRRACLTLSGPSPNRRRRFTGPIV